VARDIPIIFSAPMVQALLAGRKTMTRRLAWQDVKGALRDTDRISLDDGMFRATPWQNVKPGDRLWVRESFSGPYAWAAVPPSGWGWTTMQRPPIWYWADGNPSDGDWTKPRPSIHMPRWASRLTLVVTDTKIEPLQAISEADATAEGWKGRWPGSPPDARGWFALLWQSLHGTASWHANPEVVAIPFRVIHANIDAPEAQAA